MKESIDQKDENQQCHVFVQRNLKFQHEKATKLIIIAAGSDLLGLECCDIICLRKNVEGLYNYKRNKHLQVHKNTLLQ